MTEPDTETKSVPSFSGPISKSYRPIYKFPAIFLYGIIGIQAGFLGLFTHMILFTISLPIVQLIGAGLFGYVMEVVFFFSIFRLGLEIFGPGGRFERWYSKYVVRFRLVVLGPLIASMLIESVLIVLQLLGF